jgi:16S rRNA processing protein RimM
VTGWLPEGWVEIGRVERALGLDGTLLVGVAGDEPSGLLGAVQVNLRGRPGSIPFRVLRARARPGDASRVELRLAGLMTRDLAAEWLGASVAIERSALPVLPEGEHYAADLVGLEVRAPDGRRLGRVKQIWSSPAHDLLVVETDADPVLVPATPPILQRVDPGAGTVWVDPPAGLFPEESPDDRA